MCYFPTDTVDVARRRFFDNGIFVAFSWTKIFWKNKIKNNTALHYFYYFYFFDRRN